MEWAEKESTLRKMIEFARERSGEKKAGAFGCNQCSVSRSNNWFYSASDYMSR